MWLELQQKGFPNEFSQAGKNHSALFGSSLGFVGLDGQKAYMMNFWRAIEKHQACLSTDVAGSRKACPMNFPRHPKIIWFVPGKRLPNEFSQARKNHSAPVWQEPSLCGLGWAEGVDDEFSEGYKKHLACLATDVAGAVAERLPQ